MSTPQDTEAKSVWRENLSECAWFIGIAVLVAVCVQSCCSCQSQRQDLAERQYRFEQEKAAKP